MAGRTAGRMAGRMAGHAAAQDPTNSSKTISGQVAPI